jgi:hypothetical protein
MPFENPTEILLILFYKQLCYCSFININVLFEFQISVTGHFLEVVNIYRFCMVQMHRILARDFLVPIPYVPWYISTETMPIILLV